MRPSDDVEAGQRVYTPLVLWGYDLFVLGFSNRFVWRCRSSRMLERYNSHVGARHLDVGVGTGWYLDRCEWPVETPQITLLDLNENSLSVASKRIRRYAPATIRRTCWIRWTSVTRASARSVRTSSSTAFPASSGRKSRRWPRGSVRISLQTVFSSGARSSVAASGTTRSGGVSCISTTGRESSRTWETTGEGSRRGSRLS